MKAAQTRLNLHLSKCHNVGNHMSWPMGSSTVVHGSNNDGLPAYRVGPPSARQRNAIQMTFRWPWNAPLIRFDSTRFHFFLYIVTRSAEPHVKD